MFIHTRSSLGPTMLMVRNGVVTNISSRTPFGSASMAYSSWHPSGRLIAFSVNNVNQFFHSVGSEIRDVVDLDSAVGIYSLDSNIIMTPENLSKRDRMETYPTWSPDGRYLYFCSAPKGPLSITALVPFSHFINICFWSELCRYLTEAIAGPNRPQTKE